MKHKVSQTLNQIDYDFDQFSIDTFIQWIAKKRGHSIKVFESTLSPDVMGFWVTYLNQNFIGLKSSLVPTLKLVVLLHELAHILLGHTTADISDMKQLFGSRPDMIATPKGKSNITCTIDAKCMDIFGQSEIAEANKEAEAEELANALYRKVTVGSNTLDFNFASVGNNYLKEIEKAVRAVRH